MLSIHLVLTVLYPLPQHMISHPSMPCDWGSQTRPCVPAEQQSFKRYRISLDSLKKIMCLLVRAEEKLKSLCKNVRKIPIFAKMACKNKRIERIRKCRLWQNNF